MPARMAIHIARWSSDHAMPSPRGDTGDEGMSWRSHTRPESRAGEMVRGRPPSLALQHREVDCGHGESPPKHAAGSSSPIRNCQLRTRGERGRTIVNCELGSVDPPWLAVRHREVDIGHRGVSLVEAMGCTPPIRYERARESIARLVVRTRNTRNLPKAKVNANETLGRCNATRSYASDAVHEFPRIRSAGLFPMMSFRRSGFPQLLLMQPSLVRRREVCDTRTSKAFS